MAHSMIVFNGEVIHVPEFDCLFEAYRWTRDTFPAFNFHQADRVASRLWTEQRNREHAFLTANNNEAASYDQERL